MAVNGNRKGKVGEREFAEFLRDRGYEAKRGQQHAGGNDSPDVASNVPGVHWEVKRTERTDFLPWLQQAMRDAHPLDTAVVAHRRNKGGWIAILDMDEFLKLVEKANAA